MDLDGVADELYGLAPQEFTARRNARAKQARADGEKELATRIGRLAKPSMVAWLANQLVREHADEVDPLLELGAGLREATASLSGDALRELSRQQHQLVNALVRQARALATTAGQRVSDDTARGLETTLYAALADDAAAEQFASGRLTDALQHRGFGSGTDDANAAVQDTEVQAGDYARDEVGAARRRAAGRERGATGASGKRDAERRDAERREQERRAAELERQVDQARAQAKEADEARDRARAELDQAESDAGEAIAAEERARIELDEASAARSRADKAQRTAHAAAEHAESAAAEAAKRLQALLSRRSS